MTYGAGDSNTGDSGRGDSDKVGSDRGDNDSDASGSSGSDKRDGVIGRDVYCLGVGVTLLLPVRGRERCRRRRLVLVLPERCGGRLVSILPEHFGVSVLRGRLA